MKLLQARGVIRQGGPDHLPGMLRARALPGRGESVQGTPLGGQVDELLQLTTGQGFTVCTTEFTAHGVEHSGGGFKINSLATKANSLTLYTRRRLHSSLHFVYI